VIPSLFLLGKNPFQVPSKSSKLQVTCTKFQVPSGIETQPSISQHLGQMNIIDSPFSQPMPMIDVILKPSELIKISFNFTIILIKFV
jgi:hypothetical protein